MKIAICDDESRVTEEVEKALNYYFGIKSIDAEIFSFENGEDLLHSDVIFDMAFLDVEMPSVSGVEVGKKLKQKFSNIIIFMITAYSEYLDDAFELGAYRFLQKPLDVTRLYRSLDAALLSISGRDIKIICPNNDSVMVSTQSIIFCETYKRKSKIVTTKGQYISNESLAYWKGKLDELNFCSPHASYIINFNFVESFNRSSLTLAHEDQKYIISIAPSKQSEFRKKMFSFAERGV